MDEVVHSILMPSLVSDQILMLGAGDRDVGQGNRGTSLKRVLMMQSDSAHVYLSCACRPTETGL